MKYSIGAANNLDPLQANWKGIETKYNNDSFHSETRKPTTGPTMSIIYESEHVLDKRARIDSKAETRLLWRLPSLQ